MNVKEELLLKIISYISQSTNFPEFSLLPPLGRLIFHFPTPIKMLFSSTRLKSCFSKTAVRYLPLFIVISTSLNVDVEEPVHPIKT